MNLLISTINIIFNIFTLALIVYTLLQFFIRPDHPVLNVLGRVFEPLLTPIRNRLPPMAGFDFSPLVLFFLLQILEKIIVGILRSF